MLFFRCEFDIEYDPDKLSLSRFNLWEEISSDIRLVDINEGRFEGTDSEKYLKELINQGEYKMYSDYVPRIEADKVYTASDIQNVYEKWKDSCLTECIYPAYRDTAKVCKSTSDNKKPDCYKKLMEMTGLDEVKSTIDSIIAFSKMSKKKAELGMKAENYNNHMVFTGNPGTAKTTAARLIADILKAEGVLASGKFVECGRADLVGKFVGWTAKNVRKKFEEAKGGILFIDEAYSLCEDRNSFGTEAVNTIVQEMENNRKHVLVIFAGYPDKMKDFMEMNEGLYSRIGFHINFPDYNSNELLQILKLQARERGYTIADKSNTKLLRQFDDARKIKNYGNGRFVRNLLDQAIMKQSLRLSLSETGEQPGEEELSSLYAEDFEVQALNFKKLSNKIGFVS